jgi:hypothetical protein
MPKFPLHAISAPSLSDWQYSYGGQTWGSQNVTPGQHQPSFTVIETAGLDMPAMRSGDVGRPRDQGEFTGIDVLAGRDIQLTLYYQALSSIDLRNVLTGVESVMIPPQDGVTETPFWFKRPGAEQMCCLVRPRRFGLVGNYDQAYPHNVKPVLQFHATGALLYGPTQQAEPSTGDATTPNNGPMPVWPYFIINGPITAPWSVINLLAAGVPTMEFTENIASGHQVILDFDIDSPTAVLDGASSFMGYLAPGSVPFPIYPGANVDCIGFASSGGGGTAFVQWADAFVSGV